MDCVTIDSGVILFKLLIIEWVRTTGPFKVKLRKMQKSRFIYLDPFNHVLMEANLYETKREKQLVPYT